MCLSYPVEDGLILLNDYANVLNATFSHLTSKGIKKVHYKFHPQQMSNPDNLAQYKSIMNSFRSDLEFVELPKETIMEEVMANSNAILLSDYSSIMIYTKNFGNEIVSNYNLIQKYRSKGSKMPLLPAVLTQIINKTGIPLHQ
jgi:hypothetical protein